MQRLFSTRVSTGDGEKVEFSWWRTFLTVLIGSFIAGSVTWITWTTKCSLKKEELEERVTSIEKKYDKQVEVLHQRISREAETRMDEFESLIAKQLKIIEEQNRILYDMAKEQGKRK